MTFEQIPRRETGGLLSGSGGVHTKRVGNLAEYDRPDAVYFVTPQPQCFVDALLTAQRMRVFCFRIAEAKCSRCWPCRAHGYVL